MCSQSHLLSQSTQFESEDDNALEIEPVTLQLQQHRFSTLSQAIARSLEPTPHQRTHSMRETPAKYKFRILVGGVQKFPSDGGGPAKSRGPVVP